VTADAPTVPAPQPTIHWAPESYPEGSQLFTRGSDPAQRVAVVVGLFERLGHPQVLRASREALARADELAVADRSGRAAATQRLHAAHAELLAGRLEVDGYVAAVMAAQAWMDSENGVAPATAMLTLAQRDLHARAASLIPAETPALYRLAQQECSSAVDKTRALPPLPQPVWSAADPAAVAPELGAEQILLELGREQARFALCHEIGSVLRRAGGLGAQQLPGAVPESHGFAFRQWWLAVEGEEEIRRLRPALRLRWACDKGWGPALLQAADVLANPPSEPTPRERWTRLRGWVSSGYSANPEVEVG
jgi:hypothetical protein